MSKTVEERDHVVVRFAGDSGDGMQLTGDRFTNATAILGNDLATLPDFPAEIRAPAGTLFGVSSFQLQFGSQRVYTPGASTGSPRSRSSSLPPTSPRRGTTPTS
jgi:2-oxoglutarate ferredoxin oxidoreductase subunit alpha